MLVALLLSAALPTADAAAPKNISICHYSSDTGT